jgi:hypothetical protein
MHWQNKKGAKFPKRLSFIYFQMAASRASPFRKF